MYHLNWPNRVSVARVLLIGPFMVAMLHLQDPEWGDLSRYAALGVFALMALSDGLDGFLARRLHQETALGRFLDPLADKILILCAVVLLASTGSGVPGAQLPSTVAVIAIGKDFITVLGFTIIYLVTSQIYIDARKTGKLCTSLQLAMILSILLYPDLPRAVRWLPQVLWWAASIMALLTVAHYYHLWRRFLAAHESRSVVSGQRK